MKFMPRSNAVIVDFITSSILTERNSAPKDDAPNERIGRSRSVFPRGLVCMVFQGKCRQVCNLVKSCLTDLFVKEKSGEFHTR